LIHQACLFQYGVKKRPGHILRWISSQDDNPLLPAVPQNAMATFLSDHMPAIAVQQPQDLSYGHALF
jgi:hypothetical protein